MCEGKVKEGEGHLLVSVMNSPSVFVQARVGVATVLAYARVTHHDMYPQSLYGISP